jgi:hypothetical protein
MNASNLLHTLLSSDSKDSTFSLVKCSGPAGRLGTFSLDNLEGNLANDIGGRELSRRVGVSSPSRGFGEVLHVSLASTGGRRDGETYSINDAIFIFGPWLFSRPRSVPWEFGSIGGHGTEVLAISIQPRVQISRVGHSPPCTIHREY